MTNCNGPPGPCRILLSETQTTSPSNLTSRSTLAVLRRTTVRFAIFALAVAARNVCVSTSLLLLIQGSVARMALHPLVYVTLLYRDHLCAALVSLSTNLPAIMDCRRHCIAPLPPSRFPTCLLPPTYQLNRPLSPIFSHTPHHRSL